MSDKRGLLSVIENYKGKQESFLNKVNEILKDEGFTPKVYFILNLCAKFSLKSQPSIYGKYGKWIL